jgi:uncharacterized LabA/DUF88 family protein
MSGVGFFIDGAHLTIQWRNMSASQIDFAALRTEVEHHCSDAIAEAYCFDATANGRSNEYFAAMQRAGIRVKLYEYAFEDVYDERHQRIVDAKGLAVRRRIQKGVDVGLATYMLDSHRRCGWSRLVLAAADADFAEPVQRLVETWGVHFTILGIPEKASHTLRPYASDCIDLRSIRGKIEHHALAAVV